MKPSLLGGTIAVKLFRYMRRIGDTERTAITTKCPAHLAAMIVLDPLNRGKPLLLNAQS